VRSEIYLNQVKRRHKMEENLIDRIVDAINNDDVSSDKKEIYITDFYNELNSDKKAVVDELMMDLTGWRLETLINNENY
jgi:hypothetical protein